MLYRLENSACKVDNSVFYFRENFPEPIDYAGEDIFETVHADCIAHSEKKKKRQPVYKQSNHLKQKIMIS